jgi:hypothetical protein
MRYLKSYKLFESMDSKSIQINIHDILLELEDDDNFVISKNIRKENEKDFLEIAKWIEGKDVKYYLQNFVAQKTIDSEFEKIKPYSKEWLEDVVKEISPHFKICKIRS